MLPIFYCIGKKLDISEPAEFDRGLDSQRLAQFTDLGK